MKPIRFGWCVVLARFLFASAQSASAQNAAPPTEPILRIETGMHSGRILSASVDNLCRLMVTGSEDKTARLWALPKGGAGEPRLLQVLRAPIGPDNDGKIRAVALSPNGRFVAAGGPDLVSSRKTDIGVYVFETATGQLFRRLNKLGGTIVSLAFSPDGRYLAATVGEGQGLHVWETTEWSVVGIDKEYSSSPRAAAFDGRNRLFTVAGDGVLRRYGADFKLEATSTIVGGKVPMSVAVHPQGNRLAVGFYDTTAVEVYSTANLNRIFSADTAGARANLNAVAWSVDGTRLYAGGRYSTDPSNNEVMVRIWDGEGRGKYRDVSVARNTIVQLMPCGDSIAVASTEPAFGLISLIGEKRVWEVGSKPDMLYKLGENLTISADGSKVRFGLGRGGENPVLFDAATGRLITQPLYVSDLSKADTSSLRLSDWQNNLTPKLDGRVLDVGQFEISRSLSIVPGSDRFVLGTEYSLRLYSRSGSLIWRRPVPSITYGVNVSHDRRLIVAAYNDGTIRWHRLSDGEEILALFVHAKTREWVLWTPQGYYSSSVSGDHYVGWHLNKGWEQAGEFVTAARLKKHLYRPDIVKRAFELADAEQAVREAGLKGFKLADLANHTPPEFRIVEPSERAHADKSPVAVRIKLSETNDPVTGFDVKVNGRQVTPRDVRDVDQPARAAETLALNIPLVKGENHIQVAARNSVGETVQDLLVYLDREGLLDRKGKLFIVAAGVDKYPKLGARYTLRYAGADAQLMVDTLTKRAGPLHTEVISKLLLSDGVTPPTKANIEDALAVFRDARPEDTVMLFLASHGVNDGPDYLMMPEDAERTDAGRWCPSSVVKWSVLQQALQDAQGRRIMFVDTCHSSGAYSSRLVKDASDANIVVFSATDKDTTAQETNKLGHGVFTYAVSQGINGGADFGKNGRVNVLALGAYVSDEVKRMTNDEQEPVFSASGVKNFVLAVP